VMFWFLVFGIAFLTGYFVIEKVGLFDIRPLPNIEIIYSMPILIGSLFLLIMVFLYLLSNRRGSKFKRWAYLVAVFLIVSGLWGSYLTRFSVEVVLTEGQDFYSGHDGYIQKSLYKGRLTRIPDIGIKLIKLSPRFSDDGNRVKGLKGEFIYFNNTGGQKEIVITNGIPRFLDGMMVRIRDFGYSPRFVLKSEEGAILQSSFVYMKLFPEGNEDSFRLLSPHTYYLRYYPSGDDGIEEPLFRFRIVRNKDIVFNRNIKLSEEIAFDNGRISFEEVRRWTKLSIKRDWGEVMAFTGVVLIVLTLLIQNLHLQHLSFYNKNLHLRRTSSL